MKPPCFRSLLQAIGTSALLFACRCSSPDPATSTGAGSSSGGDPACVCVPQPPQGFSDPVLLWTGNHDEAPECPAIAPVVGYEGGTGVDAPPLECPACTCDPPEAQCELPIEWTTNEKACPGNGPVTAHLSFDAPEGWDGSCIDDPAVPAKLMCGEEECVQSLTIAPPVVKAGACMPMPSGSPMPGEAKLETYVRACSALARSACASSEEVCVAPAPEGFVECIYADGDKECPEMWPEPHVVYEGIADDRSCTPCACGEVEGASCTVLATAYSDPACSVIVVSSTASSEQESDDCHDVTPGVALGSKSASVTSLEPGTCKPSGGEPVGAAAPSGEGTFCCRP